MRRRTSGAIAIALMAGCPGPKGSLGELVTDSAGDGGTGESSDGGDGPGMSSTTAAASGTSTTTSTTGSTADGGDDTSTGGAAPPAVGFVGAAFFGDGLCPWSYEYELGQPVLTLQFSGEPMGCSMFMWATILEHELYPGWFEDLVLPFGEPGVYDLADYGSYRTVGVVDARGGAGAGAVELTEGIVEIVHVDDQVVTGALSGIPLADFDGVYYDINGPFEAVRCTQVEWLRDYQGEAPEPPTPPECNVR